MESKFSILVVDDDHEQLDILRIILESADYHVLTAKDGPEALRFLKVQPVDLVLADIAMPSMNGYQLYERFRQNPDWRLIPFIFLTARTLDSDIRYGKELGADDYLTKPIHKHDLLAVIRGKLTRYQELSQENSQVAPAVKAASPQETEPSTRLIVGQLVIETGQYRAWLEGEPLQLSAREFELLDYLAWRVDRLVSPEELIKVTHGVDIQSYEARDLLRPLIRSLRRKLGYPTGEMGCIQTIRGVGYRLTAPEESRN